MFTGIIQSIGQVRRIEPNSFGARLLIDPGQWTYRPAEGDSIAVNGVCLTFTPTASADLFAFDVIQQTLASTTLGKLRPDDAVNLESALTPSTPMGGHIVQGHIDGIGTLTDLQNNARQCRMTFQVGPELIPTLIPKGSVAIDGISLTIANVDSARHTFTVALIPTTLAMTTFADATIGRHVNIETDMLARTIVHWLEQTRVNRSDPLSMQQLADAGFLD